MPTTSAGAKRERPAAAREARRSNAQRPPRKRKSEVTERAESEFEPLDTEPDFESRAQSLEGAVDDWQGIDQSDDRIVEDPVAVQRR